MAIAVEDHHIGFGLIGVGALCAVLALWWGWTSIARWRLVANLDQQAVAAFQGDVISARGHAETALGWAEETAAVLAASDPTDPQVVERLHRSRSARTRRDRELLAVTAAFAQVLQGGSPGSDLPDGVDGRLVGQLLELRDLPSGTLPALPEGGPSDAPARAVLHRVLEERLATAWRLGDGRSLADDAGRLRLLDPRHPGRLHLDLITLWCSPIDRRDPFVGPVGKLGDRPAQAWWLRRLLALTAAHPGLYRVEPEQRQALHEARRVIVADFIDDKLRSDEEKALLGVKRAAAGNQELVLSTVVTQARQERSPFLVAKAIGLCLDAGRYATARDLLPLVPADQRQQVEIAIASASWDLATLRAVGADVDTLLPRIHLLQFDEARIHCHIADRKGRPPPKPVTFTIDDHQVDPHAVRHCASAYAITVPPATSRVALKIEIDGITLFDEVLRR